MRSHCCPQNLIFFKELQPLFRDMLGKIPQTEFIKYSGFEIVKKIFWTAFSFLITLAKNISRINNSLN